MISTIMFKLSTLAILLVAENNKCVNFDETCNKTAIVELRKECPNITEHLSHITPGITWRVTGVECVNKVPNNPYVKKYMKLLDIDLKEVEKFSYDAEWRVIEQ